MEIGTQNQQLNFPNPLRIHNYFILSAAVVIGLAGIALLFSCRDALQIARSGSTYTVLVLAALMLSISISYLYRYLSQLRFLFGRGRPVSLAPILSDQQTGSSTAADSLKEVMRQQAIPVYEPQGPIGGLLYSFAPNLLFAAWPLRQITEGQFRGLITLAVLLLGLIATQIIGVPGWDGAAVADWIGVAFLLAAGWSLINPGSQGGAATPFLSIRWLTGLVVFAVVGPVMLSLFVPSLPEVPFLSHLSPVPHVMAFLLAGLILRAVAFTAIMLQLPPEPKSAVSVIQDVWDLVALPAAVTEEFRRAMHESWRDKVPNRCYIRIEPEVTLNVLSGSFRGEMLEETQPFPRQLAAPTASPIAPSGLPALVLTLEVLGLVLIGLAAVLCYLVGGSLLNFGWVSAIPVLYCLFSFALGTYAFRIACRLRLRFDFESRLVWLDIQGHYVSAQADGGVVINPMPKIDGMTYRLWVADLHTVCFGKDEPRYLIAMDGNFDVARNLTIRMETFAKQQTAIASVGNLAKTAQRVAANQAVTNPGLIAQRAIPSAHPPGEVPRLK